MHILKNRYGEGTVVENDANSFYILFYFYSYFPLFIFQSEKINKYEAPGIFDTMKAFTKYLRGHRLKNRSQQIKINRQSNARCFHSFGKFRDCHFIYLPIDIEG